MARETKVGLLAGLAFIVCFAVILANRGRNGPPGLSDSVLTDAGVTVPTSGQRNAAPLRNPRGASPADGRRAASSSQPARPPANHTSNGAPTRLADSTPASGAELPGERSVAESPARMTPRPSLNADAYPVGGGRDSLERGAADPNREALERVLASRSQSALPTSSDRSVPNVNPISNPPPVVKGQPMSNNPQNEARPADGPIDPSARHSAAMPNERAASRGTEYRVQPSDTLSSIAATHYGTKSQNAVNAIFDANRSVLVDPDHLKVGMTLIMPTPASGDQGTAKNTIAAEPAQSPGSRPEARPPGSGSHPAVDNRTTAEPAPTAESAAFRWYQVKKNDRYASIAREQLGDTGRWKEVYELNKDKFPDPQRIREGVRIKLPAPPRRGAGSQQTVRESRR
mgnify:CR=1 FL=1